MFHFLFISRQVIIINNYLLKTMSSLQIFTGTTIPETMSSSLAYWTQVSMPRIYQ